MQAQKNFGIADLVTGLQERIQSDQTLLTQVMSYWATARPDQALNDLDDLTPLDAVETASKGKLSTAQAKWLARNREENGTSEAFVKIGKKLYANLPVLIRIITTQQGNRTR